MMDRQPKKSAATRYRHQVYVQRKLSVADGEGGFTDGWANTTDSPIWAEVSPIQARQVEQYKSRGVDATHLVRMDGYTTVDDKGGYRILFGERVLEIKTAENLQERDIELVITCNEVR